MDFNNWKKVKIKEICKIRRGASPRPINDYITNSGLPWVKIADATSSNSRYIEYTKEFIKEEGRKKTVVVEPGTLILSNSATPGLPKIMKITAGVHDGWLVLSNFQNVLKEFVYYLFINERKRLLLGANGSVFNNLKTDTVRDFEVIIPESLEEQQKIVNILLTLDEKIELNNEINNTLEEIAKTIFKHWFIDFEFPNENGEPYKSSGGKLVESELGMIPEEWYIGKLTDIAELIMGQSPKGDTYNFEGKGLGLINGASDFKDGKITPLKYTTDPKKVSKKGDWIFGVRATVGNVTYVDKEYCLGRGVGVARALSDMVREYLYFQLIEGINYLEKTALGSVYINLSKSDLENMKFVIPSKKIIKRFHETVSPLFNKININTVENNNLILLRDNLLPKLMSGEIRIPEAEEAVDSCLQKNN